MAKVLIDLSALRNNYQILKDLAPGSKTLAVIKADAYGHGLLESAKALAHADGLAVARIAEAISLRDAGVKQSIVLLEGVTSPEELELARNLQLTCVFHDDSQLAYLDALPDSGLRLDAWIKVNTGMNRLGFSLQNLRQAYESLSAYSKVSVEVMMTHLANADSGQPNDQQKPLERFAEARSLIPEIGDYSLANSAALIQFPETHMQWNRPGIALYGASIPSQTDLTFQAVMSFSSTIIAIRDVEAGECVGYGSTWCANKKSQVAVVGVGYGDGYPRHAKSGTPVIVNGHSCPLVGTVSMDMITVDISELSPEANVGDRVLLWGQFDGGQLSVDIIAKHADTISYELLCGITKRVEREFKD